MIRNTIRPMPSNDNISSWPMLELAESMGLPKLAGSIDETFVRRVEEYIEVYRAWAQDRDRAVMRHLLESPNAYRVMVPASPDAFGLAARSSWYFDEVIVEDPLASVVSQESPWRFEFPPGFRVEVPHEWIRAERAIHVMNRLRALSGLQELLASRAIILVGTPPPFSETGSDGNESRNERAVPLDIVKAAHRLADVLATVEQDADRAKVLAKRGGFPPQHLPEFRSPQMFWYEVVEQTLHGRSDLIELARCATEAFPSNPKLREVVTDIGELDSTARVGSYDDNLISRVLSERPFVDWLRSGADLKKNDTLFEGDGSLWTVLRAELSGVYRLKVHRDHPVGPGESVRLTMPRDEDLRPVDWPSGQPSVPPEFRHLLEVLVRNYLQALGSTSAEAIHLGTGILTKDRVERRLARTLLQGKGALGERSQDVADSFHVAAPMLEGLTPKQLLELREQLPLGFEECRAKLATICRESESIEEAQVAADAQLLPLVRQLEGDLESLKAKSRVVGRGAAIVTVVGTIAASFLDTALIPATLLSGGSLLSFIHRQGNKEAEEKKLRSRAALFLWEARNKAGKNNS